MATLADVPAGQRGGAQLSFNLGVSRRSVPNFATLKIGGQFNVHRDLLYSEAVIVTVTDMHREVIASGSATVGWPTFKDKTAGDTTFIERVHTATLD